MLYRPVGMEELRLVYESGLRAFPPRLPEQPICYPALNFGYVEQIARDWNTKSRSFAGYVTRFEVEDNYASDFERRVVGGRGHEELWVPAEQLDEFNRHIVGLIAVIAAYFGPRFRGFVPERGHLEGLDAAAQLVSLAHLLRVEGLDPGQIVEANRMAIFLHYPFWERHGISGKIAEDERVLEEIRKAWSGVFPKIPLTMS